MEIFPLEVVTQGDLQELCKTLWSWKICADCTSSKKCQAPPEVCPSYRTKRLGPYFEFYKRQAAAYSPDTKGSGQQVLNTHQNLFQLIRAFQNAPDTKRAHLAATASYKQDEAINTAVRVMLMVTCGRGHSSATELEAGINLRPWKDQMALTQFFDECFPTSDHPSLNDMNAAPSRNIKEALAATKLKKRAGLRFCPTDNLRRHLELDRKNGTVLIFHHTAFLKEHLRRTRSTVLQSTSDAIKLGTLPRQLALEVLDSIQKVIFPLDDAKSKAFLESLTVCGGAAAAGFDPDCCRFETSTIRRDDEYDLPYYYFGDRLMDLYAELENPTPKGGFEKWLQRRSNARYVMLATLAGVVVAIVLGIAGLCVESYQTWISYQAWKHPVTSN